MYDGAIQYNKDKIEQWITMCYQNSSTKNKMNPGHASVDDISCTVMGNVIQAK